MPAAVLIPMIIGAGASVAGAAIQAHAAGKASDAQQASQAKALGLDQQIYQTQLARTQPYVNAGTTALGGLMQNYGPGGPSFNQRLATNLAPFQGAVGMQGLNAGIQQAARPAGSGSPTIGMYGANAGPGAAGAVPVSAAGQMVWMQAPTGEVQQIPSDHVAQYEAKGAKRLEGASLGQMGRA